MRKSLEERGDGRGRGVGGGVRGGRWKEGQRKGGRERGGLVVGRAALRLIKVRAVAETR